MIRTRLFVKMVVTYFCIILSTLTMLGVLLTFLLSNYLVHNKQMEMLVKATDIAELVRPYLVEKSYPGDLVQLLNRADKNLGSEIWVIDRRGTVIAASFDQRAHEGDRVDPADIEEMRQGRVSIRQGKSNLYRETVLWVTVPIHDGSRVIGGTILYSPIMGITQIIEKVRNLFIYSAVASIIFSTVVVYILSRYFTGPLREMSLAAKLLACGKFSQRVAVKQGDEIGDLAEAFNHMAGQIEKLEKMRRAFVADVSHELRSPLTNIQGFIEAMMDNKDRTQEDRERYLGILHKETLRLARLVNELLDLSRLESGRPMVGEPVQILETVRSSAAKMKPVLEEKNVNLIMEIPDREISVTGNRDRLEQVITNLLDNAARHSAAGQRLIIRVEENKESVSVTVIDQGEGIPAEELPFIWERFYKVDKARSRETGGTGLGLAIVRQIIESLGGQVHASSEEGAGARIGFSLPVIR